MVDEDIKEEKIAKIAAKIKDSIIETYKATEMGEINKKLEKTKVEWSKDPRTEFSSEGKPKLTTGTILDEILGHGGIIAGKLIEFYGEYGAGKTQVMNTIMAEASQIGTVVLLNIENTFSTERMEEILRERKLNAELFWKNIIIFSPNDWVENLACIQQIPTNKELKEQGRPPLKLIVVDSLLCLIDECDAFEGRQKLPLRSRVIRVHMLGKLRRFARKEQCVVLVSNQVQDVPDVNKYTPSYMRQKAKGGPTVQHVPDIVLYLRKAASGTRIARIMDSQELPIAERAFVISKNGIEDIPEDLKKKLERKTKKESEIEAENAEKTDAEIADEVLVQEEAVEEKELT